MSGGGGGGGNAPPHVYTDPVDGTSYTDSPAFLNGMGNFRNTDPNYKPPMSGAEALNQHIQQRQLEEKIKADNEAGATTRRNQENETAFTAKRQGAIDDETGAIQKYFTNRGIDYSPYASDIASFVKNRANNIVDPYSDASLSTDTINSKATAPTPAVGTLNPSSVFSATDGADLYNTLATGKQNRTLDAFNKQFDPDNFATTQVSDSWRAPAIANEIKLQFDPIEAGLQNAVKRGTLSAPGYTGAENYVKGQRVSGSAAIGSLADGILTKDRGDINDYLGGGRKTAGAVGLGNDFDINPYATHVANMVNNDQSDFGGNVHNAVGSAHYATLTDALNAGGTVQGATNPTAGNPTGAVGPDGQVIGGGQGGDLSPAAIAARTFANQKRGLGSQGDY